MVADGKMHVEVKGKMGWQSYALGAQDTSSYLTTHKPLILVVDDDYAIRELLRICLEREGFRVITAKDGLEGVLLFRRHNPDAIILDIYMPMLDGWGVLEVIRSDERGRNTPIILLTVESSPGSILRGWREGIDCFISKPFDPDDLIVVIKRALESKQLYDSTTQETEGFHEAEESERL